jgi:hypothetical protein
MDSPRLGRHSLGDGGCAFPVACPAIVSAKADLSRRRIDEGGTLPPSPGCGGTSRPDRCLVVSSLLVPSQLRLRGEGGSPGLCPSCPCNTGTNAATTRKGLRQLYIPFQFFDKRKHSLIFRHDYDGGTTGQLHHLPIARAAIRDVLEVLSRLFWTGVRKRNARCCSQFLLDF